MTEAVTEKEISEATLRLRDLREALGDVLFGQELLIEETIIGLLAGGHLLFEGLPGLGKTELVKGLARALGLESKRIQFTPDLLPGDITGNPMLQEEDGRKVFSFHPGPIFSNIMLADEVNRASPKTQSALLEAMQERRVTVMGETHELPNPFFVLATQNPIDLEGTYPLPEAQLDRFLFKLNVRPGTVEVLERIVKNRELGVSPDVKKVFTREEVLGLMALARRIYIPDPVANYIARLVDAAQPHSPYADNVVKFGASPRAAIALAAAAKARALVHGRPNASVRDAQVLAEPVLQHRLILDYAAKVDGRTTAQVIARILAELPVQDGDIPSTLKKRKWWRSSRGIET